jgi:hypothetical protein
MEQSKERLEALEQVAEAARKYERLVSGTNHPGIEGERVLLMADLKKAIHHLDEVEGQREPVGKMEKWQEKSAGARPPVAGPARQT